MISRFSKNGFGLRVLGTAFLFYFTKIKRRLGWKPLIDLATGLEQVVSHYSSSF